MFNRARYNLQQFNLPYNPGGETALRCTGSAVFNAMAFHGDNLFLVCAAADAVRARGVAAPGIRTSAVFYSALAEAAQVQARAVGACTALATMENLAQLGGNGYLDVSAASAVRSVGYLSMNVLTALSGVAQLLGVFSLGEDAFIEADCYALIFAQVEGARFILYNMSARVTIPAGSILVIDTDNYVMLLDGENILALHEGDWPQLSRGTFDLLATTGTRAALPLELLYTERYL